MTNKQKIVGYLVVGDFENHCHVHYQLHRTEQAATGLADHWRLLGGDVTNDPLIRLTDHEAARAADKARIAELEEFAREIIKQYPNPDITHEQFRMHACRHAAAVIEQDCEGGTP